MLTIIDHGNGWMSLYGRNESLLKTTGEWVAPGEEIARVGSSGGATDPALYFEIRSDGVPVDPAKWIRAKGKLEWSQPLKKSACECRCFPALAVSLSMLAAGSAWAQDTDAADPESVTEAKQETSTEPTLDSGPLSRPIKKALNRIRLSAPRLTNFNSLPTPSMLFVGDMLKK